MNPIKLSFCIPTYNRVEIVSQVVMEILQYKNFDIEVVVLDNASTDDTLTILGSINDERLVVYSNIENKGGLYNVVNVINKARGEYVIFSTDKDHTDFNGIENFKSFLVEHPRVACGYCAFNSNIETEYEIFRKGYSAVHNIAYKGRHPTGYFFKNALLKPIRHTERFSDYKVVDVFPFEFILAELCLAGDGAIYHLPMFTLETGEMAAKHKSYNASGKSKEAFFSPEARLKLAISYTQHIEKLELTNHERKILIVDVFLQQLVVATIGYQSTLRDKNICAHYYMECRELRVRELYRIGFNFYKQYRNKAISQWRGDFLTLLNFELHLFLRLFLKVIRRLAR